MRNRPSHKNTLYIASVTSRIYRAWAKRPDLSLGLFLFSALDTAYIDGYSDHDIAAACEEFVRRKHDDD